MQLLPFFIFRALISTLLCTCQTRTTSAVQPKFQTAAKSVVCIWLSTQFFQKLSHSMLQNMIKNAKKPWFWHTDRPLSQPFWYKDYRFFPPSNKLALESSCVTYNDGDGRFGQALWLCFFFIIGEDSKGWPPAGKDLLLRFGCSLWLDRRRLVADYVLETPRNTQCCCSAEHMCRSRRGKKTDC